MDFIKNIFTLKLDYLFDVAKLRSANMANHIMVQNGMSQESKLALTDSERDLWNVSVRYPANAVYSYLMSAGKIQEGDYQFNISLADGSKGISYTLYLNPDWDKNLSRVLNDMIEKAIVSGGLAEWFKSSMNGPAYQALNEEYQTALSECRFIINKRKGRITRPHITF